MSHVIEEFYGVYLLYNVNPDYKGRIYIGYTVNPDRRIQQHNAGREAGGAKKTSGRGPWEMVLTVHGFPNNISALRFEWAWQNPSFSRRLKHIPKKSRTESTYQFHFRILCEMLRTGPWNRLPLTIRWLKQDYQQEFPPNLLPPMHMPIVYGPVRLKKIKPSQKQATKLDTCPEEDLQHLDDPSTTSPNSVEWSEGLPLPTISKRWQRCSVCSAKIMDVNSTLKCIHLSCHAISHIICLAGYFLNQSKTDPTKETPLIPIDGFCPNCCKEVLWGDLIRLKNGCYQNLVEGELNEKNSADNGDESDEDHWANALSQKC